MYRKQDLLIKEFISHNILFANDICFNGSIMTLSEFIKNTNITQILQ